MEVRGISISQYLVHQRGGVRLRETRMYVDQGVANVRSKRWSPESGSERTLGREH